MEAFQRTISAGIDGYTHRLGTAYRTNLKSNFLFPGSPVFCKNNRFHHYFPSGWTAFPMEPVFRGGKGGIGG